MTEFDPSDFIKIHLAGALIHSRNALELLKKSGNLNHIKIAQDAVREAEKLIIEMGYTVDEILTELNVEYIKEETEDLNPISIDVYKRKK